MVLCYETCFYQSDKKILKNLGCRNLQEQVRKGMCCKVWIILSSTIGHGDRLIWQDINRTIVLKCTPDLLDVKVQYL